MNFLNSYSVGSEYGHRRGHPINEDYTIAVEIKAVSEDGIITGRKLWEDESVGTEFYAKLVGYGTLNTPNYSEVQPGSYTYFHRVGEFNEQGTEGVAKKNPGENYFSWICFYSRAIIFIEITNSGETGVPVYFDEYGTKTYITDGDELAVYPVDPYSQFHDESPPFADGRVFPGIKVLNDTMDYYVVFCQGFGDYHDTLEVDVSGTTYGLKIDSAGHLLDFVVS